MDLFILLLIIFICLPLLILVGLFVSVRGHRTKRKVAGINLSLFVIAIACGIAIILLGFYIDTGRPTLSTLNCNISETGVVSCPPSPANVLDTPLMREIYYFLVFNLCQGLAVVGLVYNLAHIKRAWAKGKVYALAFGSISVLWFLYQFALITFLVVS